MLQILSPLARLEDAEPLMEVGADEFYSGFINAHFQHGNKRENPKASFSDLSALSECVERIHAQGKKLNLALNERIYKDNIDSVRAYIEEIDSLPFDAYIVQDYAILKLLTEHQTKKAVHLSSLAQVWNVDAISYYQALFPIIKRIIFSRDVVMDEMETICRLMPDTEFEAFILNDWCYNVDGICASLHHEVKQKGIPYICHREYLYKHVRECETMTQSFQKVLRNRPACFACAMYRLNVIS